MEIIGTVESAKFTNGSTVIGLRTGSNGDSRREILVIDGRSKIRPGQTVRATATHREPDGTIRLIDDPTPVTKTTLARAVQPVALTFAESKVRRAVFDRSVKVAREFKEHIAKTGGIIKIQGHDYVTVAGWLLLPAFESPMARCLPLRFEVTGDGTIIAESVIEKAGEIVSRGFGAATTQEKSRFNDRLAMAQTRSMGRALKARYSWIVTLAGYAPGIADEVEDAIGSTVVATAQAAPQPAKVAKPAPAQSDFPTKEQLAYAIKTFGGDLTTLLKAAESVECVVAKVEEIPLGILRRIVNDRLKATRDDRSQRAASTTAATRAAA